MNFNGQSLLFTLKILLHKFDVLIGHICYGVGVGAVEVDEPFFCDDFCSLGIYVLQVALADPTVDGVIGIAGGGDDLRYGECIGDVFKFLFEPRAEV